MEQAPPELTPLKQWTQSLTRLQQQEDQPLPPSLLLRAQTQLQELLGSTPAVLLHGDLHHGNILSQAEPTPRFLAIDPKGLWGDAAYEVGSYLLNPDQRVRRCNQLPARLQHRINLFSEVLQIDAEILKGWGFIQAVLSACWTYEDHGKVDRFSLVLAEAFST
ncbi:MAG: phosphotransferase [Candidatus Sericytochromatia bacterium]|nr:phosphotransferase [Candidatus Sericytochromatia bacterium]